MRQFIAAKGERIFHFAKRRFWRKEPMAAGRLTVPGRKPADCIQRETDGGPEGISSGLQSADHDISKFSGGERLRLNAGICYGKEGFADCRPGKPG